MNLFRLCVANLVALFWVVIPTAMGANIIPQPSYIQEKQGTFDLAHNNNILYVGKQPEVNQIIDNFMEQMLGDYGLSLQTNKSKKAGILLQDKKSLGEEAYELSVAANKVVIKASTPAGFFYALRTVNQLILADENHTSLPGSLKTGTVEDIRHNPGLPGCHSHPEYACPYEASDPMSDTRMYHPLIPGFFRPSTVSGNPPAPP